MDNHTKGACTLGMIHGYVYDTETELYYLQSRYYNSQIGRFLNADAFASTGQGLLSNNMFAYCCNNPVILTDPTGLFHTGGFFTGLAILTVGVCLLAATVATCGAASPLLAAGVATIGTAVGVATVETGVAVTTAAATDSAAVFDVSCTGGLTGNKNGYSVVLDFEDETLEAYSHYGISSSSSYSVSYSAGVVYNYSGQGSYGGDFVDVNGSLKFKGVDLGIDFCCSPEMLSGKGGTAAIAGTVGFSLPALRASTPVEVGYDYYTSVAFTRWR